MSASVLRPVVIGLCIAAACAAGSSASGSPAVAERPPQIVFVRQNEDSGVEYRLFLSDASGRTVKRITREEALDPAWSPDGSLIAYSTDVDDNGENTITVATLRGPLRRIRSGEGGEMYSAAWSPNGRLIAFVVVHGADSRTVTASVGVAGADGKNVRILGEAAPTARPTWSPDSRMLAYDGPTEIAIASAVGGKPRRLVARGGDPAWSPQGTKIAFASARGVETVRPDGSGRQLLVRIKDAAHVAWSPRGRTISFDRYQPNYEADTIRSAVYELNPDGSGMRRMTSPDLAAAFASWSPDGTRLAFVALEGPESGGSIYVMRSDGAGVRRITPKSDRDTQPVWRPHG